ncbi:MAG: hypothetical protein ACYC0V_14360 [Armatimonadota bacterium]
MAYVSFVSATNVDSRRRGRTPFRPALHTEVFAECHSGHSLPRTCDHLQPYGFWCRPQPFTLILGPFPSREKEDALLLPVV